MPDQQKINASDTRTEKHAHYYYFFLSYICKIKTFWFSIQFSNRSNQSMERTVSVA